jgi:hypothetical protein
MAKATIDDCSDISVQTWKILNSSRLATKLFPAKPGNDRVRQNRGPFERIDLGEINHDILRNHHMIPRECHQKLMFSKNLYVFGTDSASSFR